MTGPASVTTTPHPDGEPQLQLDLDAIRATFPILDQEVHGRPLVYLDNAATTQKPLAVIETIDAYYRGYNANVHRGVHALSQRATDAYEGARQAVADFIHATTKDEVVWVRGTTEAINLVAHSFVRPRTGEGDEILITAMEHHSNIVPWQMLCQATGATLKVAPIHDDGSLDVEAFAGLLNERTRFAAVTHVSNALGTINPVKRLSELCHANGTPILVDGAQAAAHVPIDVQDIGCDFYTLSAHKVYGPTGIGALWGRMERLEAMDPYQGGGDMILSVSFEKTVYNKVPFKFEAGTPDIAGAIGFGAALSWFTGIGPEAAAAHEHELMVYATERLAALPGVRIIGTAAEKAGLVSFVIDGVHPHDVGTIVDRSGIAVRAGHHCAQPVMKRFGVPATTRASFAVYNTKAEVDSLVESVAQVIEMFA